MPIPPRPTAYIRYMKDPTVGGRRRVRRWSASGGAAYVTVARRLMNLEGAGAPQG
ncbi:hypothetical protein GCM10010304_01650 [Streptomyces roseoviolaceus]